MELKKRFAGVFLKNDIRWTINARSTEQLDVCAYLSSKQDEMYDKLDDALKRIEKQARLTRQTENKYPRLELVEVIRELEQDPVTGLVTMRSITDPKRNSAFDNDSPVQIVTEDKGTVYHEPDTPPDPDGDFEERLEAEGAFIINSTTYFPGSKTTITKKSYTPAEIAEQRGYNDSIER
jgi:hypothetical protein